jgi:5-methylcytosine-specific restriction endonuclease McrA
MMLILATPLGGGIYSLRRSWFLLKNIPYMNPTLYDVVYTTDWYAKRMPRKRSWTDEQLILAVKECYSIRSVIGMLGLIPAGGNYAQVRKRIVDLNLATKHFTGKGWNKGKTYHTNIRPELSTLLVIDGDVQSYKLKQRLYETGLKHPRCELCGWAEVSLDGRIPVELDHINGDHHDNRLENLRILCPNCHSLQLTHRGKNKNKVRLEAKQGEIILSKAANPREGWPQQIEKEIAAHGFPSISDKYGDLHAEAEITLVDGLE